MTTPITLALPPTVVISPTGTQGPRGNATLNGTGAPASATGIDGDYYIDRTNYPTSVVMYGPKAAGAWPGTGVTIGAGSGGTPSAWIFDVKTGYGAKGDGKVVTDGAMTASSAVLACATSAPFTAGDVGKSVMVKGAGAAGVTTLVTTISGFTDTGHVTLAATAATTVSGALVMFASDDTAAFKAAINAAVAYAQGAGGAARVFVPAATGRFYGIAGALISGGATLGNAQIPLPVVPATGNKVTLTIEGASDGSGLQHWQQTVPTVSGSTLVSFGVFASSSAQTASINAAGNACVIGGPSQPGGYGVAPGVFSNMNVVVRNLSVLTTHSANGFTYTSMDLSGVANAGIENFAYGTAGTVAGNDYANPGTFATGLAIGLLLPASGNNDNVILRNVTCHGGYTYAVFATEHCDIHAMRILYCWAGFCPVGSYYNSVGSTHAIVATLLSIEACTYVVYVIGQGSSGVGPFLHLRIDTETSTPRFGGNGGGVGLTSARGDVVLTGLYTVTGLTLDAPCGFDIINGQASYAAQAVAANYVVTSFDELVTVDATAGARTVTLPTAVGRARRVVVTKTDASVNTVTVGTTGGQTINGTATKVLTTQWATAELLPTTGGNWTAGVDTDVDATAADIATLGTRAAGAVGKPADAGHVHPRTWWTPEDHGLITWSQDPATCVAGQILPAAGAVNFARLHLPAPATATNILMFLTTQGSALTAGQNFAGLYTSGGTLIASTADQAAAWITSGTKTMALTGGPYQLTAGDYLVGFFANGTTLPTVLRGVSQPAANVNLSAAASRFGAAATGQTTAMPAAIGTLSGGSNAWWVGLS